MLGFAMMNEFRAQQFSRTQGAEGLLLSPALAGAYISYESLPSMAPAPAVPSDDIAGQNVAAFVPVVAKDNAEFHPLADKLPKLKTTGDRRQRRGGGKHYQTRALLIAWVVEGSQSCACFFQFPGTLRRMLLRRRWELRSMSEHLGPREGGYRLGRQIIRSHPRVQHVWDGELQKSGQCGFCFTNWCTSRREYHQTGAAPYHQRVATGVRQPCQHSQQEQGVAT